MFIVRDLYSFGCPRVGGLMDNISWALQYKTALDNHTGKSWRMVNQYDPVTDVPPVIPLISTWNHVDNGYRVSDDSPAEALPSEIGTQPSVSIKPWNASYHGEFASLLQKFLHRSVVLISVSQARDSISRTFTMRPDLVPKLKSSGSKRSPIKQSGMSFRGRPRFCWRSNVSNKVRTS